MQVPDVTGAIQILKRLLVHAGGFNLGLLIRQLVGVGKPRRRQGAVSATLLALVLSLWHAMVDLP